MGESTNKFRQNFNIKCKINNMDFTNNLQRLRIVGSVSTYYHMFILEFMIESERIIAEDMFGKHPIQLSIVQVYEDMNIAEQLDVELIFIRQSGISLKNRPQKENASDPSMSTPTPITIACIPKIPLENMSRMINKCFHEDFQKTPIEALQVIADEFAITPNKISLQEKNEVPLSRTFNIPRMHFSELIRYLDCDDLGGLYNSPYVAFHGLNEFYIWSTKKKIHDAPVFTVHLLPTDADISKIIRDTSNSDDVFYTKVPIETKFSGQEDVAATGGKFVVRVNPNDDLYHEIVLDAKTIMKENAARTGDLSMEDLNDTIQGIEKYTNMFSGSNYDDAFLKSKLSKKLSSQSEILISLSRNINIRNLLNVGSPMDFKPHVMDYLKYDGHYIMMAIDVTYDRSGSEKYVVTANMRCTRSNLKL